MTQADADTNPLRRYFENNRGRMMDKWLHYFDVYHRHFQRFRGSACTILEIGVYHGGSLQMWRDYFGPDARIIGLDINPRVKALEEPGTEIVIGDQANRAFMRDLKARYGPFDIVIDDGGHVMAQQIVTLEEIYDAVKPEGVFLVEDLHTSYWREYGGGYRHPFSFIELAKGLIDQLNAWHSRDAHSFPPTSFTHATQSLHFYDSMLVIEKGAHPKPEERKTGTPSFPD